MCEHSSSELSTEAYPGRDSQLTNRKLGWGFEIRRPLAFFWSLDQIHLFTLNRLICLIILSNFSQGMVFFGPKFISLAMY